jgi:hypothetical protein
MRCDALKQWWKKFFKADQEESSAETSKAASIQLAPLSLGLRIDLAVPTWAGKETEASQFIWVSPTGSHRSVNALRVLLIPN